MINFLIAVALILFVILLIVYLVRIMNENIYINSDIEDEVTTTTTTTTTTTVTEDAPVQTCTIDDLEPLTRFYKPGGQPYCIDPVDGTEWVLNTKDDMYEDAADKWWRLVDANVPKV